MALQKDDKERICRIGDFLQSELNDLEAKFIHLDYKVYKTNSDTRRNLERCIENIVNASLDIAKIILICQQLPIPDTYREYFNSLSAADLIDREAGNVLADGTRLRNILAHQYLDIRWEKIAKFLASDWKVYQEFFIVARKSVSE